MNIEDKVPPWHANVTVPTHVPYAATMYVHKLAPGPNGVTWKMLPATVRDLIAACRKLGLSVSEIKAAEVELREVGHGDRARPSLDDIAKAEEYRSSSDEGREPSEDEFVPCTPRVQAYYMERANADAARIKELAGEVERLTSINAGLRVEMEEFRTRNKMLLEHVHEHQSELELLLKKENDLERAKKLQQVVDSQFADRARKELVGDLAAIQDRPKGWGAEFEQYVKDKDYIIAGRTSYLRPTDLAQSEQLNKDLAHKIGLLEEEVGRLHLEASKAAVQEDNDGVYSATTSGLPETPKNLKMLNRHLTHKVELLGKENDRLQLLNDETLKEWSDDRLKLLREKSQEIAALEQSFAKRTSTSVGHLNKNSSVLAHALSKGVSVHLDPVGGDRWQVTVGVECVEALSAADFTTYSATEVPVVLAWKLGVSE